MEELKAAFFVGLASAVRVSRANPDRMLRWLLEATSIPDPVETLPHYY